MHNTHFKIQMTGYHLLVYIYVPFSVSATAALVPFARPTQWFQMSNQFKQIQSNNLFSQMEILTAIKMTQFEEKILCFFALRLKPSQMTATLLYVCIVYSCTLFLYLFPGVINIFLERIFSVLKPVWEPIDLLFQGQHARKPEIHLKGIIPIVIISTINTCLMIMIVIIIIILWPEERGFWWWGEQSLRGPDERQDGRSAPCINHFQVLHYKFHTSILGLKFFTCSGWSVISWKILVNIWSIFWILFRDFLSIGQMENLDVADGRVECEGVNRTAPVSIRLPVSM